MSTWTPAHQPTGSRGRLRGRDFPGARCRRRGAAVGRLQRVTAALQVAIAVPLIVLGGISLDRVRSTATADLGFASDLLYAVPLKVDADKIANPDFRIRHVRDDLAKANGVAGRNYTE